MTKEQLEAQLRVAMRLTDKYQKALDTAKELQNSLRNELRAIAGEMDNDYRRLYGFKVMCPKCKTDIYSVRNIGKFFCKFCGKYYE